MPEAGLLRAEDRSAARRGAVITGVLTTVPPSRGDSCLAQDALMTRWIFALISGCFWKVSLWRYLSAIMF